MSRSPRRLAPRSPKSKTRSKTIPKSWRRTSLEGGGVSDYVLIPLATLVITTVFNMATRAANGVLARFVFEHPPLDDTKYTTRLARAVDGIIESFLPWVPILNLTEFVILCNMALVKTLGYTGIAALRAARKLTSLPIGRLSEEALTRLNLMSSKVAHAVKSKPNKGWFI